jgi:hypothetical protein
MLCREMDQQEPIHWTFDAWGVVLRALKHYSLIATAEVRASGNKAKIQQSTSETENDPILAETVRLIQKVMNWIISERSKIEPHDTTNKRWLLLKVVNTLFKLYFRLNKLSLGQFILQLIYAPNTSLPHPQTYPSKADQVTFHYFAGISAMNDGNYVLAGKRLRYAFKICHVDAVRNKRRILQYLIPVQLLLGQPPSNLLLEKYPMEEFHQLIRAYKIGNVNLYSQALELHSGFFIKNGTYLILERVKKIVYRNLFRIIVFKIRNAETRVKLTDFLRAVRYFGVEDMDLDEIECIVASLIHDKFIKGYISHAKGVLVIAKQHAFPNDVDLDNN